MPGESFSLSLHAPRPPYSSSSPAGSDKILLKSLGISTNLLPGAKLSPRRTSEILLRILLTSYGSRLKLLIQFCSAVRMQTGLNSQNQMKLTIYGGPRPRGIKWLFRTLSHAQQSFYIVHQWEVSQVVTCLIRQWLIYIKCQGWKLYVCANQYSCTHQKLDRMLCCLLEPQMG